MSHGSKNYISVGCWNIAGLKDKHRDKHSLDNIKGYILCLQETKCMPEKSICIHTYHVTLICRQREDIYPVSGGMILLINPLIKKGVDILENKSSEVIKKLFLTT